MASKANKNVDYLSRYSDSYVQTHIVHAVRARLLSPASRIKFICNFVEANAPQITRIRLLHHRSVNAWSRDRDTGFNIYCIKVRDCVTISACTCMPGVNIRFRSPEPISCCDKETYAT